MPYNNRILVIDDNPAILEVFKSVFDKLKTEHVADSVAKAFLRRASKWGIDNNGINAANMSTALMAAIIAIRDDE